MTRDDVRAVKVWSTFLESEVALVALGHVDLVGLVYGGEVIVGAGDVGGGLETERFVPLQGEFVSYSRYGYGGRVLWNNHAGFCNFGGVFAGREAGGVDEADHAELLSGEPGGVRAKGKSIIGPTGNNRTGPVCDGENGVRLPGF